MKIRHILKSRDFATVLEKGDRIKGSIFSLYLLEEKTGSPAVGIIIPKKLARLAVQRNYLKRLIYAFFREQACFPEKTGPMIVVRLTKDISSTKSRQLSGEFTAELGKLLEKAKSEK